jgi:anti-sigma-K factor RskA
MNGRDDIEMLAAEYVLGTLDGMEREAVARRRARDSTLDAAITAWERRLVPFNHEVAPVDPPAGLLARIEARLANGASHSEEPAGQLIRLERLVSRWRKATVAATALAASLALAIGLREAVWRPAPQSFVAVFQKDDALPSFLLTIDLASRQLTVRPVAAERQPEKTYQLWIASDRLGPAPRSLGLLDDVPGSTSKSLTDYDSSLLQKATFGVSVEPPGGSPTGRPTGPALHATLIPATP